MIRVGKKDYLIPEITFTKFETNKPIMESPTHEGDIVTFVSEYESMTTIDDLLLFD